MRTNMTSGDIFLAIENGKKKNAEIQAEKVKEQKLILERKKWEEKKA